MMQRLAVTLAKVRQRRFTKLQIDLRLIVSKLLDPPVCDFAIIGLERLAKQLAADADMSKIDARC